METASSTAIAGEGDGTRLRHLDLFSGIGGFALAARRTGRIGTAAFCEIDPFCRQVLHKHWPDTPIFHDIRDLTKDALAQGGVGTIDLVTGGFPCQPFSVAGKRRGQADDRHLWPQMRRVVAEVRPRWVVGENVANFVNMGLDECLSDLEAEGYEAWAIVLPACAVGAPHRRERVWVVAHADDGDPRGPEERPAHGPRLPEPAHGGPSMADADGLQRRQVAPGRHRADGQDAGREEAPGGPAAPGTAGRAGAVADADRTPPGVERGGATAGRAEPAGSGRRAVEPNLGGTLDGFSAWLDGSGMTDESHRLLLDHGKAVNVSNANAAQAGRGETLRALRDSIGPEALRRTPGGLVGISSEAVLLAYLRKLEEGGADEARIQPQGAEAPEGGLRGVRRNYMPDGPPPGPGHRQQRPGKHPDFVQALPRLLALHAEKAWTAYRWQNAPPVPNFWSDGWEDGIARVADGVPRRVGRLRALGNAIVPQVAYAILSAIADYELDCEKQAGPGIAYSTAR